MLFIQVSVLAALTLAQVAQAAAPNFDQLFAAQEAAAAKAGVRVPNAGDRNTTTTSSTSSASVAHAHGHGQDSALRRHAKMVHGNKGRGMQRVNRARTESDAEKQRRAAKGDDNSLDSSSVPTPASVTVQEHIAAQYAAERRQGGSQTGSKNLVARGEGGGDGYWFGASSYYLHTLHDSERYQVLDALKNSGFKVVRIFIASVGANNKVSRMTLDRSNRLSLTFTGSSTGLKQCCCW